MDKKKTGTHLANYSSNLIKDFCLVLLTPDFITDVIADYIIIIETSFQSLWDYSFKGDF